MYIQQTHYAGTFTAAVDLLHSGAFERPLCSGKFRNLPVFYCSLTANKEVNSTNKRDNTSCYISAQMRNMVNGKYIDNFLSAVITVCK